MDAKEFEILLHDVEVRLDRLKALYEQYFQGFERLEPHVVRKDFDRRVQAMRRSQPRNTALRFRFQMLWQRYTTYVVYWNRVTRQMEEGTYRRHIQRANQRRRRGRDEVAQQDEKLETDNSHDLSSEDGNVEAALAAALGAKGAKEPSEGGAHDGIAESEPKPVRQMTFSRPLEKRNPPAAGPPPVPPNGASQANKPPPPSPRATRSIQSANFEDDHIRKIYREYVAARQKNNERVDNVRYEAVERSIRQMLPKLQQKHQGKEIDFKVVVKDGRVGLKPVAK